jgi:putative iron-dependent peroxidase
VVRPFTLPQFGIFAQGTHAHHFLEFDLKPGVGLEQAVAGLLGLRTPAVSTGGVNVVIAFGADALLRVGGPTLPEGLAPFEPLKGAKNRLVPASQHDIWLWLSGAEPGVTWQSAHAAAQTIGHVASLAGERQGFTFRGGRDVTGFIDGTANPPVHRAADVALVPPCHAGEGGSHVLTMRWIHDLVAFNRLSVEEQERVFGRTKTDSVELSVGDKPATAHIARVETIVAGQELEIFRRSVPYGTASEAGLNFLAFSADRTRFDRMLARMFAQWREGAYDHLTDYSHSVGGGYYFAPSLNALNEIAGEA